MTAPPEQSEERAQERLARVRAAFAAWEVDALLVGSAANRRWLSGFTGSAGWLLVTAGAAHLATDFRYWDQAEAQAPAFSLFRLTTEARLVDFIRSAGAVTIGVEAAHLTLADFDKVRAVDGISWKPLAETLEPVRAVKTPAEIEQIRAAAAVTDDVMAQVNQLARPGQTEADLAWELEKRLRQGGGDAIAFPIIVASGPNAARPHHTSGQRQLQDGDALIVDMGAALDGYMSDLTRSFFIGDEPSARYREVYDLVLAAQEAALDAMRPGVTTRHTDGLARETIAASGHAEHFGHGLGHGVGLEVHEEPHLSPREKYEMPLQSGMVTTVEPGVYIPGWGGVRIEDLVLVIDDGVESLSRCPKQPRIPVA